MLDVSDVLIEEHYGHLKDKPFFESIRNYIQSSPVIVMALVGINAVSAIRLVVGPTAGFEADAGSVRGDFSMSKQSNLVHASDSVENGISEVKRFFKDDELFNYKKIDTDFIYSDSK